MTRYLLLILLSSWSHVVPLSLQCETGVALPNHELSVTYSLMANADVAFIKTYKASDEQACLKDCCIEKYGSCTVASFKKNASESNCHHFNCRPVFKCKFVSSNSTDSFSLSFSLPQHIVPSSAHVSSHNHSSTSATEKPKVLDPSPIKEEEQQSVTKEVVATFSEEQFDLKNDNTTIKPRKGVDTMMDFSTVNDTKSGIKPRKGVTLDDIEFSGTKSKVKPRKGVGVGPYESSSISSPSIVPVTSSTHSNISSIDPYKYNADDVVSALEKVFEDDSKENDVKPTVSSIEILSENFIPSSPAAVVSSVVVQTSTSTPVFTSSEESHHLQSSFSTNSYTHSSSVGTPSLHTTTLIQSTKPVTHTSTPSTSSSSILEHSKLLFHEISEERLESQKVLEDKETESERKYKSSMHLVLSLVFGLLVLFSVMGVIAKRVYDGWMRRHYRRMDFLIDGMYNAYG